MVITILILKVVFGVIHMDLSQVLWVLVVVQKEYNQLFYHPEVVLMSLIRFWDFFGRSSRIWTVCRWLW